MTRATIITEMHDRLGLLATTAGLTDSEGSYGKPLDVALRALTGDTDLGATYVYNDLLDVFEQAVLRKLLNYYSFYVDTSVGPRKQSYSQVLAAVERRVKYAPISVDNTFDLGDFNPTDTETAFPIDWFEVGSDF